MKEIKLTQGYVALVDDEDYERVNKFKWYSLKNGYTIYAYRYEKAKNKYLMMHREILNCPNKLEIDHIDFNGLNNLRNNLRICTKSQNMASRRSIGKSKYLGVYLQTNKNSIAYRASLTKNRKTFHLGYFHNEIEAAMAYDKAAIKYHGEFANLNFK